MRLNKEQLQNLKKKYQVDELWSYSKYDTYLTSPYLFFLKYVKHENPENEVVSAYAPLGTAAHDILEDLYTKEDLDNNAMVKRYLEEWDYNINVLDEKFDRGSEEKDLSIRDRYLDNMKLFFRDYKKLPYDTYSEGHVTIEVAKNIVFHGYIDATYKDKDGNFVITDYKTSSIYRGEQLITHSYQLVLYCEGIRQMGVPANKIKCCFNFLKYLNYSYLKADGKNYSAGSIIERRDLGKKIQPKLIWWCDKLGCSEEQKNEYIAEVTRSNSIDCLPDNLKDKFKIECARVFLEDPFKIYEELKLRIVNDVKEIQDKIIKYNDTNDEKIFWDEEDNLKKQSYFFNVLMEYSISQHKPYADYLNRQEAEKKEAEDLLGVLPTSNNEDDDSWMDDLFK